MAKHADDGQSNQETGDGAAPAMIALPRNTPNIEPPSVELTVPPRPETLRALPPPASSAKAAANTIDEDAATFAEDAETIDVQAEPVMEESAAPRQTNRFLLLAASVAVAAVLGSVAGSLATSGLTRLMVAKNTHAPAPDLAAARALKQTVAQLNAEVTSLKASVEAVNRTNTTQYARLTERFDRIERAQTDPAAKLAKITEQLDRLEKRPTVAAAPAPAADVTGSIGATRTAMATPPAQPAPPAPPATSVETKPAKPPILDGWILRGVYRGRALIESRYGEYEVMPGSSLPGLGHIEDVVRQDGHWVVVTQKGLITSMP